jgi:outer membrane protein assembly factor BamA
MTLRVIEVWDAADRSESLYQRINDALRDNKITREELVDIKYSTVYIPDDKKITSQALIIFDKKDNNQVRDYSVENNDSERKEVIMTELDVVEDKDELLRE